MTVLTLILVMASCVCLALVITVLVPAVFRDSFSITMTRLALSIDSAIDAGALPSVQSVSDLRRHAYDLAAAPEMVGLYWTVAASRSSQRHVELRRVDLVSQRDMTDAEKYVLSELENQWLEAVTRQVFRGGPLWLLMLPALPLLRLSKRFRQRLALLTTVRTSDVSRPVPVMH